jgi:hypothetical protein
VVLGFDTPAAPVFQDEDSCLQPFGFHIEHAGTTGTPRGRPRKGIAKPELLEATTRRALEADKGIARMIWLLLIAHTAGAKVPGLIDRKGQAHKLAQALYVACVLNAANVNTKAFASLKGRDESTIRGYRRAGEEWVRANPLLLAMAEVPFPAGERAVAAARKRWESLPKNLPANSPTGGSEMDTTAVVETLDRIELRQTMQGQALDHQSEMLDRIWDFLLTFEDTPAEEWRRWLEERRNQN